MKTVCAPPIVDGVRSTFSFGAGGEVLRVAADRTALETISARQGLPSRIRVSRDSAERARCASSPGQPLPMGPNGEEGTDGDVDLRRRAEGGTPRTSTCDMASPANAWAAQAAAGRVQCPAWESEPASAFAAWLPVFGADVGDLPVVATLLTVICSRMIDTRGRDSAGSSWSGWPTPPLVDAAGRETPRSQALHRSRHCLQHPLQQVGGVMTCP